MVTAPSRKEGRKEGNKDQIVGPNWELCSLSVLPPPRPVTRLLLLTVLGADLQPRQHIRPIDFDSWRQERSDSKKFSAAARGSRDRIQIRPPLRLLHFLHLSLEPETDNTLPLPTQEMTSLLSRPACYCAQAVIVLIIVANFALFTATFSRQFICHIFWW